MKPKFLFHIALAISIPLAGIGVAAAQSGWPPDDDPPQVNPLPNYGQTQYGQQPHTASSRNTASSHNMVSNLTGNPAIPSSSRPILSKISLILSKATIGSSTPNPNPNTRSRDTSRHSPTAPPNLSSL